MANNNANGERWASIVSYRECTRNYARQRGRYAVDGCPDFQKGGGVDGMPEALFCAACGCHRNFHRREEVPVRVAPGVAQILHQMAAGAAAPPPGQAPVLVPQNPIPAPSDENLGDGEVDEELEPRRMSRARLTASQKEAMREYAERLGWSLQGHNEEELHRFCSDIGIISQVFKVWMRNNKRKYVDAGETSAVAAGGS